MAFKRKVVLLGDNAVGKTSLIRRFVFDLYEDSYIATIGAKVTRKAQKIEGPQGTVDLTLVIWDLIGREGYAAFHARTLAGTRAALLVADLTRRETLDSLERYWIPLLMKVTGNVPLVFAANKCDLSRHFAFQPEDMGAIASRYSAPARGTLPAHLSLSYATSAKTGMNVERAFETLGHLVVSEPVPDPVRELYESLVALGVRRSMDTTTAVGALDAIIVDFCEGFEDQRLATLILRQEIARASVDLNRPTKDAILRAVDYLAEAEYEFGDPEMVRANMGRRRAWALAIRE